MTKNITELFVIIGITFIILEIILGAITGFDLLLVGVTLIIGGVVGSLTNSITLGLITTILLSGLYIVVGRTFIKKILYLKTTNTNIDAVIGEKGVVVKEIKRNVAGRVKVNGEIWRAVSDNKISVGEEIMVQSAQGVTLKVI